MTFTAKYNILESVSFMDIELDTDNRLFVDPYLIYISNDDFSLECSNSIASYFDQLLHFAKTDNIESALFLVQYLQENNEVRFGYSTDKPCGRGIGSNKGQELFRLICESKAVQTGLISDIFDASIMLDNVGYDKISDLTINIILEKLIFYTKYQCSLYNVPLERVELKRPIWNSLENCWRKNVTEMLPVHNGIPIILVPKNYVRPILIYSYIRFYNLGMIPYYEKEALKDPSLGLVRILKRGLVPAKMKIRQTYPCIKDEVIAFIEQHPE